MVRVDSLTIFQILYVNGLGLWFFYGVVLVILSFVPVLEVCIFWFPIFDVSNSFFSFF